MTRYTPQWLQAGSYAASQDRRLLTALWPNSATSGLAVSVASGMTLNIAPGQAAVPSPNQTGSMLCTSDAVEQVVLPAAPASGTNRIDLIIVRPRSADWNTGTTEDFIFDSVQGAAVASPTVPAIPAGSVALAQVYIPGGSASITAGNITDVRPGGLPISSAVAPISYPRGTLAQVTAVANSAGTTTSLTWVTAPAVTVDGTRRLKVSFRGQLNAGTANDVCGLRIMDGATQIATAQLKIAIAGGTGQQTIADFWEGVPSAGTHTYALNVILYQGTGPTVGVASSTIPAHLLIEDVGT